MLTLAAAPKPPHDCRITARCIRSLCGFAWPLEKPFSDLRSENSVVDDFFELRENDERGGEGGERVRQIKRRPAFKLTSHRMRGATWFEKDNPPQGLVWLLGAEFHDERHQGRSDAYDILAALDSKSELFPRDPDYQRLELDRRRRDTAEIAEDVRRDAAELIASVVPSGGSGTVAGVAIDVIVEQDESVMTVYVAVSEKPVLGRHSRLRFSLTEQRFLGIQAGLVRAFEELLGPPVLVGEMLDRSGFPRRLSGERPFVLMVDR